LLVVALVIASNGCDATKLQSSAPLATNLGQFCSAGRVPAGTSVRLIGDETLDCELSLSDGTRIDGAGHQISFGMNGMIKVAGVTEAEIENLEIVVKMSSMEAWLGDPRIAFISIVDSNHVTIKKNKFLIDIPSRPATQDELHSSMPFGKSSIVVDITGKAEHIVVEGNTAVSKGNYTARFLASHQGNRTRNLSVENNVLSGFHVGVQAKSCEDCSVKQNRFSLNSYTNIEVGGKRITVSGNIISFSGGGSDGDGITVQDLEDSEISHNTITFGFCYGIWFVSNAKRVNIVGNVIASGIVTGINLENTKTPEESHFEDIVVRENVFNNNAHWGFAVNSGSRVTIEKNIFIKNRLFVAAPGQPGHFNQAIRAKDNYRVETAQPVPSPNFTFLNTEPEVEISTSETKG